MGTSKTSKRWLAALMAACVALACGLVLSACSSGGGTSSSASSTASGGTAQASTMAILYEQDDSLINNYSLLAVNPEAPFADADGNPVSDVKLNTEGAKAFITWMLSDEGKKLIADYGVKEYGEALFTLNDNAPSSSAEIPMATDDTKVIRLSTTTSVNDSGLLDAILPAFQDKYGYEVEVSSTGTGKAIASAKAGNADAILVHSKSQEEAFVNDGFSYTLDGYSTPRLTFMHNYFVICGPTDDPAGVKSAESAKAAFKLIADGRYQFVSRGDKSGTHTKEISLWPEDLGVTSEAESVAGYTDWYNYSNAGMGVCLTMAKEKGAYILSDKTTFLTFENNNEKPLN